MDEIKKDEVMVEDKPKEKAETPKPNKAKSKTDDFIARKLKVINNINNPAKARSLAERVLNNRKAVK